MHVITSRGSLSCLVSIGLLGGVVACNPYVKPVPVDSTPQAIPIKLHDKSPVMTTLSSLTFDMPIGTNLGQMEVGYNGCGYAEPMTYSKGTLKWDTRMYDPVFKDVMDLMGVPVEQTVQRFEGEEIRKADLQIAATIKEMTLNICYPEWGKDKQHARGEAYLVIDWAVFSPLEKTVVYSGSTSGRTAPKLDTRIGEPGILREAFRDALVKLAAKQEFADVVASKKGGAAAAPSSGVIVIKQPAASIASIQDEAGSLRSAVVTIRSNSGEGSGFALGDGGYVVTAAHVVSGSKQVKMLGAEKKVYYGEVVRTNPARDLALIKVSGAKLTPLHVSLATVREGFEIFAVGSPLGEKFAFSVSRGVVSGFPKVEEREFIQSDVTVLPGSSGGPLVDRYGNVIGVTASGISIHDVPAGMNFFIPAREIFSALSITATPESKKD